MSTVLHPETSSKSLRAIALFGARKILSDKEADECREFLEDGSSHELELTVSALIDGEEFEESFQGRMTVGHGSTRAGSVDAAEWVTWILSHVPEEHQKAILAESVETFQKACKFDVNKSQYEQVKKALSDMREINQTDVRGSVSFKIEKPRFKVVR